MFVQVRDGTLVDLGVQLQDSTNAGEAAKWCFEDPEVMRREAEEAKAQQQAAAKQKFANKLMMS